MGNTTTHHPVFVALQELLHEKWLKVRKSTIARFTEAVETYAPSFPVSGHLTLASWDKLGRDLGFAFDQGDLGAGVRPLWALVRSCLLDVEDSDGNGSEEEDALSVAMSECSIGLCLKIKGPQEGTVPI